MSFTLRTLSISVCAALIVGVVVGWVLHQCPEPAAIQKTTDAVAKTIDAKQQQAQLDKHEEPVTIRKHVSWTGPLADVPVGMAFKPFKPAPRATGTAATVAGTGTTAAVATPKPAADPGTCGFVTWTEDTEEVHGAVDTHLTTQASEQHAASTETKSTLTLTLAKPPRWALMGGYAFGTSSVMVQGGVRVVGPVWVHLELRPSLDFKRGPLSALDPAVLAGVQF